MINVAINNLITNRLNTAYGSRQFAFFFQRTNCRRTNKKQTAATVIRYAL